MKKSNKKKLLTTNLETLKTLTTGLARYSRREEDGPF